MHRRSRYRGSNIDHDLEQILNEQAHARTLSSSDFARILQIAARSGAQLKPQTRRRILYVLEDFIPSMSAYNVAITLWSLGSLNFTPRSRHAAMICDKLIEKLNGHQQHLGAQAMVLSLVGMARLGVRWKHTKDARDFLTDIAGNMDRMDAKQMAQSLWAMGKIDVKWSMLTQRTRKTIERAMLRTSGKMLPIGVANSVCGLSFMKAKWKYLSTDMTTTLEMAIRRTSKSMKEQEVSNCISGLGRLGVQWRELPVATRNSLGAAFIRVLPKLGAKGLTMTIHGLGHMGASWLYLPVHFRESILSALRGLAPSLNAQEVSNVIYGLGKMGVEWNSLLARDALAAAVTREAWQMRDQGISTTLYGLALSGAQFRELPGATRAALLGALQREAPKMHEQEVANSLFALGRMGASWVLLSAEVRSLLVAALVKCFDSMQMPGMVMSLQGLGRLGFQLSSLSHKASEEFQEALTRALTSILDKKILNKKRHEPSEEGTTSSLVHAMGTVGLDLEHLPSGLSNMLLSSLLPTEAAPSSSNKEGSWGEEGGWERGLGVRNGLWMEASHMGSRSVVKKERSKIKQTTPLNIWQVSGQAKPSASAPSLESAIAAAIKHARPTASRSDGIRIPRPRAALDIAGLSSSYADKAGGRTYMKNGAPGMAQKKFPVHSIMESMGRMGTDWGTFHATGREALVERMMDELPRANAHGVAKTLHAMSSMKVYWGELDQELRDLLVDSIASASIAMDEKDVSVTFLSLSKLHLNWEMDLPKGVRMLLRQAVTRQVALGEHALASLLYGLAKLDRRWSRLHPDVRAALTESFVVCHAKDMCTVIGVTNSIYGLAGMGVNWHADLSSGVQLAIMDEVCKIASDTSMTQITTIVHSFATMGLTWQEIPSKLQQAILRSIEKYGEAIDSKHVSSLLLALGNMGVPSCRALGGAVWNALENCLVRQSAPFASGRHRDRDQVKPKQRQGRIENKSRKSPVKVSAIMSGKHSGEHVTVLKPRTSSSKSAQKYDSTTAVTAANGEPVTEEMDVLSAQGLSMSITGLAKLGLGKSSPYHRDSLSSQLSLALRESMTVLAPDMTGPQLASALHGFIKLGFRWESLGESVQRVVLRAVFDKAHDMEVSDYSSSLPEPLH